MHQYTLLPRSAKLDVLIKMESIKWKDIFKLGQQQHIDFKKPLTPRILSDPNNPFVKTLVYIYSMESFVYYEMNKASRTKDVSKIKFYGPFASALGYIIHCGNKKTTSLG